MGSNDVLARSVMVAGALLIAAFYTYLGLHNPYVGFLADDALYLLMADIYSPYHDALLPVYSHVRDHSQLPPLFPLLLGLLGAGTDNLAAARICVAGFMIGAHVLFYLWLRSGAIPRRHALPIFVLQALLPITLIYSVDLWSEGLYLCYTFLALLAFRYAEKMRFTMVSCLAVGIVVGCAIATRTVGFALVPAMLLLCYRSNIKSALLMGASLVLFLLLIAQLDMGDMGVSYSDLLRSGFGEEPFATVIIHLGSAATAAWNAFAYDLFQWREPGIGQGVILAGLLGLAIIGLAASMQHAPYAVIYLSGYCAIIALWPFPEIMNRLVFTILPLWFYFAYQGVVVASARLKLKNDTGPILLIAAIFVLAAPSLLGSARQLIRTFPNKAFESFRTTRYWIDATRERSGMKELRYLKTLSNAAADVTRHVPAHECIHTVVPNIILAKSKRIAWLPLSEAAIRAGDLGRCRYYFSIATTTHGRRPMFPYSIIKNQVDVVAIYRPVDIPSTAHEAEIAGILFVRRPLPLP